MVCFDTTFLIDLLRNEPAAEKQLQRYTDGYEPLTTTPVSVAELFKGAYSAREWKSEIAKVNSILDYLEIIPLSVPACEKYGRLINDLRKHGSPIGDLDALIASTAIVHRQILVTRNKKHFDKIPELVAESW